MGDLDQDTSNQTDETRSEGARRGAPKGRPKPANSGRKPGVPNKVSRDIREAASKHGKKALEALVALLDNPDPKIKATAAREILDRAYGKPTEYRELTGKDGAPLNAPPEMSDTEIADLLLHKLVRDEIEGESKPRTPEETDFLRRVAFTANAAQRRLEGSQPEQAQEAPADVSPTMAPDYGEVVYTDPWEAQRAERDLARAEGRRERPVRVWVDPSSHGGSAEQYSQTNPKVVRLRPRRD